MEASFYSSNPKFYVSVDCIIFGYIGGALKVLLQKRDFEPFAGEWSVQGSFVQEGEDLEAAALRTLHECTGIRDVYIAQVGTFGQPDRDPGARVITTAFVCLVDANLCSDEAVSRRLGYWADVNDMPQLHFGHGDMVMEALEQLRLRLGKTPVGFYLMPPLFTLTQLQTLHEVIMGETMDKRNFRKKIAEMPYIQKTDKIDKLHSKRGAALYRYELNDKHFKHI